MKRVSLLWSLLLVCVWNLSAQTRELTEEELDDRFNFYVVNDLGRNGYYDQRPIAERMGEMEPVVGFEFIAALGDVQRIHALNEPGVHLEMRWNEAAQQIRPNEPDFLVCELEERRKLLSVGKRGIRRPQFIEERMQQ